MGPLKSSVRTGYVVNIRKGSTEDAHLKDKDSILFSLLILKEVSMGAHILRTSRERY